jgi:hypothetical protein
VLARVGILIYCCFLTSYAAELDTTDFVVMGEGLAAGMANYGLSSTGQTGSFPALMAAQMNTAFAQPLIQPPGIGDVVGYPQQEVRYPTYPQGSVRFLYDTADGVSPSPPFFVQNASVPGLTLSDAIAMRPVSPVMQNDMKQTAFNLLLGFPQLFFQRPVPMWTQFEYAQAMNPTLALVELGYYEALDAAVKGDPTRIPDAATFGKTYTSVLAGLRGLHAEVVATTIPNPIETAYFTLPAAVTGRLHLTPSDIQARFNIASGDYITRNGLVAISNQLLGGTPAPLPAGSTLSAATAAEITRRVSDLNAQIASSAASTGAVLYDLNAFFHQARTTGLRIGSRSLTADYLGGFYSLDAVYPGPTGHALIANDILAFLNRTYGRSFPMVDAAAVAATDPAANIRVPAATASRLISGRDAIERGSR